MTDIQGATAASYVIPVATNSKTGSYLCKISPPVGSTGLPSFSVPFELVVLKAPQVAANGPSSVTLATGVVGTYYSLSPVSSLFDSSTDRLPSSFKIGGLPKGLTFDAKTGLIYGYPTQAAQTIITITAINGVGSDTVEVPITLEIKSAPVTAAGTFVGGVDPQDSLNGGLGGRLDVVNTSQGAYTGKLTLGGTTYPLTGHLGPAISSGVVSNIVSSSLTIARPGKTSLLLSFSVDLSNTARVLSGTISDFIPGTSTILNAAGIGGWRALADADAKQLGRSGYHTLVFDHPAASTDATQAPLGRSYFTASVSDPGVVTLGGRLADGTAITGSCVISSNGNVLVFQSLYGALGSMYGSFTISSGHAISAPQGGLVWYKKATTDRNYKTGFARQALVFTTGGLYVPPAAGTNVLGVADTGFNNAYLNFSGGALASPITPVFELTGRNALILSPNNYSVVCTIIPGTGVYSGTFKTRDTPARTATFYGVIAPKEGDASKNAGYGAFVLPQIPSPPVTAATAPILSGPAVMTGQ